MLNRNPNEAYDNAIDTGRLSANEQDHNYAGDYMYMGTNAAGKDLFKHIDTRKYLQ